MIACFIIENRHIIILEKDELKSYGNWLLYPEPKNASIFMIIINKPIRKRLTKKRIIKSIENYYRDVDKYTIVQICPLSYAPKFLDGKCVKEIWKKLG